MFFIVLLECTDRTFGDNCSEHCGFCKSGSMCNVITYACLNGCEPGYDFNKNATCIASKLKMYLLVMLYRVSCLILTAVTSFKLYTILFFCLCIYRM